MNDPRLGHITEDAVQFPAQTVSGNAYSRPVSTRNIGGGYFVALDMFPPADVDVEVVVRELQQIIAPKKQKLVKEDVSTDDAEPVSSSL